MKLNYKDCGKIGFTCSTFDLLHAGHITMLEEAKHHFGNTITYYDDQYEALIDADCLAVLTEWPEFKIPNFKIIDRLLNTPTVFDGRNIYDKNEMAKNGFYYSCIGIDTTSEVLKPELSLAV